MSQSLPRQDKVATPLKASPSYREAHVANVLTKMKVECRTSAIRCALDLAKNHTDSILAWTWNSAGRRQPSLPASDIVRIRIVRVVFFVHSRRMDLWIFRICHVDAIGTPPR